MTEGSDLAGRADSRRPATYALTLAWLGSAVLAILFLSWLFWSQGLLGAFAMLPLALFLGVFGLAVLATAIVEAWRRRRDPAAAVRLALLPVGTIAVTLLLAFPAMRLAGDALSWARFLAHRHAYEAIAARAAAGDYRGGDSARQRSDGVTFEVDAGPPARVAFPLPGGLLDNWGAIVHDPTGAVGAARGFRPGGGFAAPPAVRRLFGGDLLACKPMIGDFYLCSFT